MSSPRSKARDTLQTIEGGLFDYPKYYDVVFGTTSNAEFKFLLGCLDRHAGRAVRRVFEPACGSGRLLIKFAERGYDVCGCDLNRHAVDYCNARLRRKGLPASVVVSDIEHFRLPVPADAAFNMISSFQHLLTESSAESHLRSMEASIAGGGIYVVGVQLMPSRGGRTQMERWSGRRGQLFVASRMWTKRILARRREEVCGLTSDVITPRARARIREELTLRTYTARQMDALLRRVPGFACVATYDFTYDLASPIVVGPDTQDVVYVLRKA